ncbi:MAG: thioredoxin [Candidatus Paceibacterota bacterium]
MPIKVSDQNFEEEVLNADKLVLVDFWADWCKPCEMIAPIVEKLDDNLDELKVAKLDVDDNQKTASKYGINGIPSLLLFEDGEKIEKFVGVKPYEELEEAVKQQL